MRALHRFFLIEKLPKIACFHQLTRQEKISIEWDHSGLPSSHHCLTNSRNLGWHNQANWTLNRWENIWRGGRISQDTHIGWWWSEWIRANDVLIRSKKDANKVNYPKLYPEFPSSKPHLAFYSSKYVEGQQTPNQWNYKSPPYSIVVRLPANYVSVVDRV